MSPEQKMPHLIFQPYKIYKAKDRYPEAENPKPVCSKCLSAVRYAKLDMGYKDQKPKRGRPSKQEEEEQYQRFKLIGYWCTNCGLFYYPNGLPEYRIRHEEV